VKLRWRWWLTGAFFLTAFVAHRALLRWSAGTLVTENLSHQATTAYAVFDGDLEHDRIAVLYHSAPHSLLLISHPPRRLEVAGLRLNRATTDRMALEVRGIPTRAIQVISSKSESTWNDARSLAAWLLAHPGDRVVVLCKRFNSRNQRLILDRVLGDNASRVDVVGLLDSRYDESNWWQRKEGAIAFQSGLTLLMYNWIAGEGETPDSSWDPDAYERTLP